MASAFLLSNNHNNLDDNSYNFFWGASALLFSNNHNNLEDNGDNFFLGGFRAPFLSNNHNNLEGNGDNFFLGGVLFRPRRGGVADGRLNGRMDVRGG